MVNQLRVLGFLCLLSLPFISQAQSYWGIDFTPGLAGAMVKATSGVGQYTQSEFNDSIQREQTTIFAPSFGIHFEKRQWRFDEFYIGLRYQMYGWGRRKTDLLFPDTIHGDIGKIQAVQPVGDVMFRFRFHNISLPFYYVSTLRFKKIPVGMNLGVYFGGALNVVVAQKATAETIGFTAYGKRNFDLPSETFDVLPVTVSLQAGLRMRQAIGDDYYFSFMPGFSFIPIPSNNKLERQYQYKWQAGLGISKKF